ncbi:MAG: carbohydrate ABC transporter permease [Spirochaetota bacterium]
MDKLLNRTYHGIKIGFLWLYAALSAYPLIWMLFYSLKTNNEIFITNPFGPPTSFRIENYREALTAFDVPVYFMNSLIVSVITVAITLVLAVTFGYATARLQWRGRDLARLVVVAGLFIPAEVILIPISQLITNLGLTNSRVGLVLPYVAFNLAFASLIFYGFCRTIPTQMEEAAFIDGASFYQAFARIIIPLLKPALATSLIFIFLAAWNEFTLALIIIRSEALKTLPLGLLYFSGEFATNWGATGAALTLASIPSVVLYLIISQQVEKALTIGARMEK